MIIYLRYHLELQYKAKYNETISQLRPFLIFPKLLYLLNKAKGGVRNRTIHLYSKHCFCS